MTPKWDRYSIAAEVKRRGSSLKQVALDAGLSATACIKALERQVPAAERALSVFLGVPVDELFAYRKGSSSPVLSRPRKPRPPSQNVARG